MQFFCPDCSRAGVQKRLQQTLSKRDRLLCTRIIEDLMCHPYCVDFAAPVNLAEVPDYLEHIPVPMDLSKIKARLTRSRYGLCCCLC